MPAGSDGLVGTDKCIWCSCCPSEAGCDIGDVISTALPRRVKSLDMLRLVRRMTDPLRLEDGVGPSRGEDGEAGLAKPT